MELKFYICKHCGNIIVKVKDSGVPVVCCGERMSELVAGSQDASLEKHVPVYKIEGNKIIVTVGSVEHPMIAEHHIEWIVLQTKLGHQFKTLSVDGKPQTCFSICEDDEIQAIYAYCNLHGLWKTTI